MTWDSRTITFVGRLSDRYKSIVRRPRRTSIEKIEKDHSIRVNIHIFGIFHMLVNLGSHWEQGLDTQLGVLFILISITKNKTLTKTVGTSLASH
jgi:hypothetical protein